VNDRKEEKPLKKTAEKKKTSSKKFSWRLGGETNAQKVQGEAARSASI